MKIKILLIAQLLYVSFVFAQEKYTTEEAKSHIGEKVMVIGEVSQVTVTKSKTTFINLDGRFPDNKFTVVIFKDDAGKFTNVKELEGRVIEVKGKIELYKGKPQIVLKKPDQINVMETEEND